ncbi:DsrE family protein [Runella limosa]|jgi:hypothetical protein|uniref:DsrE family protein n=1 Tax=Runella limosa TaxID=370978 RepID=UPI0004286E03|nr:DsrE family protein [Runella limosa]MCA0230863.1 DsrE family protein [Bacteroidota bacterium]
MKKVLIALLVILSGFTTQSLAQQTEKVHKVVFHLATSDTLAHKALAKQLSNVLDYWKNAQIEVVVHNNGIGFMKKNEARTAKEIEALKARGVTFAVCENTLKQRKIDKSEILPEASFVPVGIAELVLKQEEGWAYIKAGF